MAALDEMWARFSLTEEEEGGAEVPKDVEVSIHRLVLVGSIQNGFLM